MEYHVHNLKVMFITENSWVIMLRGVRAHADANEIQKSIIIKRGKWMEVKSRSHETTKQGPREIKPRNV